MAKKKATTTRAGAGRTAKKKTSTRKKTTRKKATRKQAATRDEGGRFLPGVSGNPSGRPPGVKIADVIRRTLAEDPDRVAYLVKSWISLAAEDVQFAKMLLERNEGKVPDEIAGTIATTSLSPDQWERVNATIAALTPAGEDD